ncbi:LPP20 family lipoprotein [Litoribrevibacter euphylliae]|uniref:LPP20 family lipoprotein n=1 Tax=Litoribrevibacter euphylliae TaxID=1834034 RepID=A0ABV7HDR4_9GAMM
MKISKLAQGVSTAVLVLSVTACTNHHFMAQQDAQASKANQVEKQIQPVIQYQERPANAQPQVIRVKGYGTIQNSKQLNSAQKHLMGMRASKLDAYRAMAERVYGTALEGGSSIENLIMQDDRFKTYVDAFVHGAKVVNTEKKKDGIYETVLEMTLDKEFFVCLSDVNYLTSNTDCRSPLPPQHQGRSNYYQQNKHIRAGHKRSYFLD